MPRPLFLVNSTILSNPLTILRVTIRAIAEVDLSLVVIDIVKKKPVGFVLVCCLVYCTEFMSQHLSLCVNKMLILLCSLR